MAKVVINSELANKARKKYLSANIALNLIQYNKESKLIKSYWNSFHCREVVYYEEETKSIKSTYCKNRWCPTCQSIRVAKLINEYKDALDNLENTYFVTLTKPTVEEFQLPDRIKEMNDTWRLIHELSRKKKMRLKGVRKAECTLTKGKYHYHYHVIVEGESNAEWLLNEWLKRNTDSSRRGQCVKRCDEMKLIELFKYVTKLSFKAKSKISKAYEFKCLDVIFRAMHGKRVYNAFGIKKINEDNVSNDNLDNVLASKLYSWIKSDWMNKYGHYLTGYEPDIDESDYFSLENNVTKITD